MWQRLLQDDPHLTSSIWPEQHCQKSLSLTLTMALNMLVPSLLISALPGVSPMRPQAITIHNQMDSQRHV